MPSAIVNILEWHLIKMQGEAAAPKRSDYNFRVYLQDHPNSRR